MATHPTTPQAPHPVSLDDARMARRMVMASRVPSRDADDVTQEVLCALAFRPEPIDVPPGFTPERARAAFLWAVVQRQVANRARRQARLRMEVAVPANEIYQYSAPSAETQALASEALTALRLALEKLKEAAPELHEVLDHVTGGKPIARLASRLGLPLGTAWNRLRRARAALRALLDLAAAAETRLARTAFVEAMRGRRRRS